MATSVQIKACGGLAPFSWTVAGPGSLSSSSGISTTVSCSGNSSSPVVVTVTDSVGVSVSSVIGGSCVCAVGDCDPNAAGNAPTIAACYNGALSQDTEIVCVPSGATTGGTSGCAVLCCPPPLGTNQTPGNDPPPCATPEFTMNYGGVTSGTPATGLLVRTRSSTDSSTTGMGFIIDESDNSFKVYRFVAESIATGGTLELTSTSQGPGVYLWEPWVFGSDEWRAGYFYIEGPSGVIFDQALANFWTTIAEAITAMGSGGGLKVCVWGKKSGTDSKASWSALSGECGLCYPNGSPTQDPTCTAECGECFGVNC